MVNEVIPNTFVYICMDLNTKQDHGKRLSYFIYRFPENINGNNYVKV